MKELIRQTVLAAFSREQLFTLLVAALALVVSVKSCALSQRTAELAEREFSEQRLITLKAEVDNKAEILKISTTEGHLTLLKARVQYPKELDNAEWPIDSPDFKLYVLVLKSKLLEMIGKAYPSDPKNFQILDDASVPLVIESQYIARGISYFDKSLYRIEYRAFVSSEKYKMPEIDLKGLIFIAHLASAQDTNALLSDLWKTINKQRPTMN